jgi:arylsulfatase A-like enzyme
MRRIHNWMPVTTWIVVGLAWGLVAALFDGLPLLLQGSLWPYLGSRLLAWAYLATIYGLLGAAAGGALGCLALIGLRLIRRNASRAALAAACAGLFVALTITALWFYHFNPNAAGWPVVGLLAIAAGLITGWVLSRAACGGTLPWSVFRSVVLCVFGVAVVAIVVVGTYRLFLRDLPLFNPSVADGAATAEQPNIVLVTASGLRPDHLGIYGYDPAISPNIDALARRGIRFEQTIAQASWTEASMASLLTSLYPTELGIACRAGLSCQPHLDQRRLTLPEALQGVGYNTQGYATSPWLIADLGFGQGFDHFEGVRAKEPFDLSPMEATTLGRFLGCRRDAAACRLMEKGHAVLFDAPIPSGSGGDQVNARVARFLDLHGDERFFLWIHYTDALPPYNLEPPFRPLPQDPLASPERALRGMGYWELGDPFTVRETLLPLDVQGLTALYDGEVNRVDRLVGGLVALLETYGLTDRTLVVLTGTHGQEFMEHGGYTYGHTLYDEVLRVPLIVAGPGISAPGQVVKTPVGLLDLAPTLLDAAGASIPPEAEGRSLVPALRGQALAERPVFSESLYRVPYELKAMRQNGYKLIYHVDDGSLELYDLNADPGEQRNLSGSDIQATEMMKSALSAWMEHTLRVMRDLPRAAPPTEFRNAVW